MDVYPASVYKGNNAQKYSKPNLDTFSGVDRQMYQVIV